MVVTSIEQSSDSDDEFNSTSERHSLLAFDVWEVANEDDEELLHSEELEDTEEEIDSVSGKQTLLASQTLEASNGDDAELEHDEEVDEIDPKSVMHIFLLSEN